MAISHRRGLRGLRPAGQRLARPLRNGMPRIGTFYGIVIWIYHDEIYHRGRPYFHATYGGDEASIDIETLKIIAGDLPPRANNSSASGPNCTKARCARTGSARSVTNRFNRPRDRPGFGVRAELAKEVAIARRFIRNVTIRARAREKHGVVGANS